MVHAHWLVADMATLFVFSFNIFFMKYSQVSKISLYPHAIHDISAFCKPLISSFFELVIKVLILFSVFACLLDLSSSYCSMASFENKGTFTSIASSLMNTIKSQSAASLCSFLLTFISSQTHLSFRFLGSFESSMEIASGVSREFHWLDCVMPSHLTKKLKTFL